jgi:nucleotidyltransferase/DNA polymerase involved in DNA repair
MIACLAIPGFPLRAALRSRPSLALAPAALAPAAGEEPLVGAVTAAAEAAGVKPGMRMGEALANCPRLVLVEEDPAGAEQAWEEILRRLEDAGIAVESAELTMKPKSTKPMSRSNQKYPPGERTMARAKAKARRLPRTSRTRMP